MMTTKPDDILNIIEEHGTEYTEIDYLNLLQLQYRSLSTNEKENFDLKKYEQLIKQTLMPKPKNKIGRAHV